MSPPSERLILSIDIGSTTVKVVVVDASSRQILWSDYQRHETRQAGKTLELLKAAEAALPAIATGETQIVLTGSGAKPLMRPLGASFVHEVNAVTLAVEAVGRAVAAPGDRILRCGDHGRRSSLDQPRHVVAGTAANQLYDL